MGNNRKKSKIVNRATERKTKYEQIKDDTGLQQYGRVIGKHGNCLFKVFCEDMKERTFSVRRGLKKSKVFINMGDYILISFNNYPVDTYKTLSEYEQSHVTCEPEINLSTNKSSGYILCKYADATMRKFVKNKTACDDFYKTISQLQYSNGLASTNIEGDDTITPDIGFEFCESHDIEHDDEPLNIDNI